MVRTKSVCEVFHSIIWDRRAPIRNNVATSAAVAVLADVKHAVPSSIDCLFQLNISKSFQFSTAHPPWTPQALAKPSSSQRCTPGIPSPPDGDFDVHMFSKTTSSLWNAILQELAVEDGTSARGFRYHTYNIAMSRTLLLNRLLQQTTRSVFSRTSRTSLDSLREQILRFGRRRVRPAKYSVRMKVRLVVSFSIQSYHVQTIR